MKKIILTTSILSSILLAGGDLLPLENLDIKEDVVVKQEVVIAPIKEEKETNLTIEDTSTKIDSIPNFYVGTSLNYIKTDTLSDYSEGFGLSIGIELAEYLDAEVRYAYSSFNDDNDKSRLFSLLAKPNFDIPNNQGLDINLYGLAGITKNENSLGFGSSYGIENDYCKDCRVFVDYLNTNELDKEVFSIGVSKSF